MKKSTEMSESLTSRERRERKRVSNELTNDLACQSKLNGVCNKC